MPRFRLIRTSRSHYTKTYALLLFPFTLTTEEVTHACLLILQNSPTDLEQVSIAIAAKYCGDKCPQSIAGMGLATILYNGTFNPQYDSEHPQKGLHQDFKFRGSQLRQGQNMIGVVHFAKIGVSFCLLRDREELGADAAFYISRLFASRLSRSQTLSSTLCKRTFPRAYEHSCFLYHINLIISRRSSSPERWP